MKAMGVHELVQEQGVDEKGKGRSYSLAKEKGRGMEAANHRRWRTRAGWGGGEAGGRGGWGRSFIKPKGKKRRRGSGSDQEEQEYKTPEVPLCSATSSPLSFVRGVNGYIYTVGAETSSQWFWSERRGGRRGSRDNSCLGKPLPLEEVKESPGSPLPGYPGTWVPS